MNQVANRLLTASKGDIGPHGLPQHYVVVLIYAWHDEHLKGCVVQCTKLTTGGPSISEEPRFFNQPTPDDAADAMTAELRSLLRGFSIIEKHGYNE